MPQTFIYQHPNRGSELIGGQRIHHGAYVYFLGHGLGSFQPYVESWVFYSGGRRKEFSFNAYDLRERITKEGKYHFHAGIAGLTKGYVRHISDCNHKEYGSRWYCPQSRGSQYTVRKRAALTKANGSVQTYLNPGDIVVFGKGATQGETGSRNKIRMWGYRRGGTSGALVETFGCYISESYLSAPSNYNINTM